MLEFHCSFRYTVVGNRSKNAMEIFVKILYGLMFFCMGVAIIRYRKQVYEWTGKFSWAERYL